MPSTPVRVLVSSLATLALATSMSSPAGAGARSISDPSGDAPPKYDITGTRITATKGKTTALVTIPKLTKTGTVALSFRQDNAAYGDYEYYALVTRTVEAGAKGYVWVRSFAEVEYHRVDCPISKSWKIADGTVRIAVTLGGDSECPAFDKKITVQARALTASTLLGLVADFDYQDQTATKNIRSADALVEVD